MRRTEEGARLLARRSAGTSLRDNPSDATLDAVLEDDDRQAMVLVNREHDESRAQWRDDLRDAVLGALGTEPSTDTLPVANESARRSRVGFDRPALKVAVYREDCGVARVTAVARKCKRCSRPLASFDAVRCDRCIGMLRAEGRAVGTSRAPNERPSCVQCPTLVEPGASPRLCAEHLAEFSVRAAAVARRAEAERAAATSPAT